MLLKRLYAYNHFGNILFQKIEILPFVGNYGKLNRIPDFQVPLKFPIKKKHSRKFRKCLIFK